MTGTVPKDVSSSPVSDGQPGTVSPNQFMGRSLGVVEVPAGVDEFDELRLADHDAGGYGLDAVALDVVAGEGRARILGLEPVDERLEAVDVLVMPDQ